MGTNNIKRVGYYLRVSTGEQTTDNQRQALDEVATRAGWDVVQVYQDEGISGARGRDRRPAFDALLRDATQRKIDLVAAWSVDRLGRSMSDLVSFLSDLRAVNCDLYLHQQALDTSTPSGRAFFQMIGVFAEFERAMIQERVKAGLARARQQGKQLGRSRIAPELEVEIRRLRAEGIGILSVAKKVGVGTGTVQRVDAEAKAQARNDAPT